MSSYNVDDISVAGGIASGYGSIASGIAGAAGGSGLLGSLGAGALAMGPVGWAGLALSGLGAVFGAKSQAKQAQKNRDLQRELGREQGDEERKSALYKAMLGDYYGQKNKYRKAQAASNYTAYGRSLNPSGALGAMVNFDSPNKVQDPGVAPPSPAPLFETRKGASWNYTNKPLYSFDGNGQLISNSAPSAVTVKQKAPGG